MASIERSPLSTPKDHRHAKLELKERAIFPVPLMVQDFDRRSNPNCPFNHAQANLTRHEHRRRLDEKFSAPGVNNRRFPSPKTKPCEKLKKSFLFAFGHSLYFPSVFLFFHVSPSHCRTQNRLGHAPGKIENLPMYRNLHWSHRSRGWSHRWRRLASPIFFFS